MTKIGNRWRLISHEEAWHLLAPRLTSSDVSRFEQVAIDVFGTISPEFELPVEERSMAGILGKVLPHSETVREGVARSLALLGTVPRPGEIWGGCSVRASAPDLYRIWRGQGLAILGNPP